ncbi:MAG: SDR family NAD(P)-dependent oxidoreductase [Mangrovicoccus sp.]|nr:SDR family NAD(P)-dependent oxidoreductase [Mangrovicoccus sp.]
MSETSLKTVIVTGNSRGLGLAISRRVAADPSYRLIGLSRSLTPEYQDLIDANPDRVEHISFDAGDLEAIPALVKSITETYGPIWGLVNNAAMGMDGVLATLHASDISKALRVNLESPIVLSKYVSRGMLSARQGRVINITSIIASTGFHALSVYAATKAGLEGFTRSLSREVGKRGVTVNAVAPGYMETAMTEGIDRHNLAMIRRRAPLGLPSPDEAAAAVLYLLGPDAGHTSGHVITVDGGSTA